MPNSTPPAPYVEHIHDLVTFDEAVSARQITSHTYSANVHPHWSYTPAAHGGYLISVATAVVKLHFATTLKHLDQSDTFSLHYEFLLPVGVGKIEVCSMNHSVPLSVVKYADAVGRCIRCM